MGRIFESDDYFFIGALLLFTLINFNPEVSTIYQFMSIISWAMFFTARQTKVFKVIPVEKTLSNRTTAMVWGVGSFAILLFVSSFILPLLGFSVYSSPQAVLYGTDSAQALFPFSTSPALADSKILSVLIWGQIIPIIETMYFFGIFAQWIAWKFRLNMKDISLQLFISGIFVLFHITAKGVTNNPALIVTFLFAMMSMQLVARFQELKQAIILHITANTLAIVSILGIFALNTNGILSSTSPILGIGALALLVFLFVSKQSKLPAILRG